MPTERRECRVDTQHVRDMLGAVILEPVAVDVQDEQRGVARERLAQRAARRRTERRMRQVERQQRRVVPQQARKQGKVAVGQLRAGQVERGGERADLEGLAGEAADSRRLGAEQRRADRALPLLAQHGWPAKVEAREAARRRAERGGERRRADRTEGGAREVEHVEGCVGRDERRYHHRVQVVEPAAPQRNQLLGICLRRHPQLRHRKRLAAAAHVQEAQGVSGRRGMRTASAMTRAPSSPSALFDRLSRVSVL